VQSPHLIVEVLSDTTEAYDHGDNFSYFRAFPSVQELKLALDYLREQVEMRKNVSIRCEW
jgi:hypothetical protein